MQTSYFVKTAGDHCESKHEVIKHAKTCCSAEKEKEEKDCCNDQSEFFKINLDYYSDPSIAIPTITSLVIPSIFEFVLVETKQDYYSSKYVNPPPKKVGKDILIQHQVFLI